MTAREKVSAILKIFILFNWKGRFALEYSQKTALIIGASGLVGSQLLDILLHSNEYEEIRIFVRKQLNYSNQKLKQIIVDFDRLDQYNEHLLVDDVFCCLGTTIKKAKTKETFKVVDYDYPIKLASMAKDCGVKKFLVITAMGADPNSAFFYNRVKGNVERKLKEFNISSLFIFRPSLLLGNREEFRFGEKLATYLSPLFSIFLTGNRRKYRPIQAEDVAKAMYHAAQSQKSGVTILESDEISDLSKK